VRAQIGSTPAGGAARNTSTSPEQLPLSSLYCPDEARDSEPWDRDCPLPVSEKPSARFAPDAAEVDHLTAITWSDHRLAQRRTHGPRERTHRES
jgi:hypothetical protein